MTDVTFVHPAAAHETYGSLATDLTAVEPPAWLRMCAAYARDRGYAVSVIDQEAEALTSLEVAERVRRTAPRLVVVCVYGHQPSASTQQMPAARAVAQAINDLAPSSIILFVGGHVSALPERTLSEEPCDYACVGEGPVTIDGLLRDMLRQHPLLTSDEIPGLVQWHSNPLTPNPLVETGVYAACNPRASDLPMAALHGRAWDLLPMDRYRAHVWQCLDGTPRAPYASIVTSLGCPHRCDFCCINAPFEGHRYRTRDPAEVVAEVAHLYRAYGVRTFKIVDELFILNKAHYRAVAEGLTATGFAHELSLWAYARPDTVDPTDLDLLARAGIRWLALGIEAASPTVRLGAAKALRGDNHAGGDGNDSVRRTVAAIRAAGINVISNYIFGLEDDTAETMHATLALAQELNTEWANFYSAMPYPGSPLYARVARTRPEDLPSSWAAYSQHAAQTVPLRNAHLTAAEILAFRDRAHATYFSSPRYVAMLRKKFGHAAVMTVERMLSHRLERDLLRS